ncbi:hypothetical protein HYC85_025691 [Camellia sinensis]|uniref:Calcineurin-like phosphoesterase domain-containing protein n=1 Tax=Camellia sinensis TaxID=4442 RepID=A0A7J7GD17_CAMSI|nr:hypothetical protein HYC85_025691 [Camellia sinensis]
MARYLRCWSRTIMSVTFLFFILAVGWTVALPTMPEKHLHVGPGGVFKIALFADLHFGEGEEVDWGPQQDVNSSKVMSTLLHIEIPAFLCSTMAWCWTILSVTYLSLLFRFIVAVGWTVDLRTTPEGYLQVLPGAAFKISLFADLHFGENAWNDWGPQQDVNSLKVMSTVLDLENPDFVIYLGDVITANNMAIANATLYWDQAISPTKARGIPWSSLFGNHDDAPFEWPMEWFSASGIPQLQCPASRSSYSGEQHCSFRGTRRLELMRNEIAHNTLSYSRAGPKELWPSISNYVLLLSSSNDSKSPVAFLYFIDSGGGTYPEVVSRSQADWFQRKSHELNPDSRVPEIIFWHIPSKAYEKVAPMLLFMSSCVGSINKERIAPQQAEMGIMKLLEGRPSVKAVFAGHNHGLDWCCPYKKLWLCYARHTGYGGYGNWPRGARILEITSQPFSLKSWIRMEDGNSHSEVILSS